MIELAMLLLGLGSTEFTVTVGDAATGKPLDGAFVVSREFATVGQIHGSRTYCIRGDAAQASGPRIAMRLPNPGSDSLRGARAIEALAYRPGYCLARTADGRATSFVLHGPSFGAERPKPLDPAVETHLAMRRSMQGPEDRLLYLGELVHALVCEEARWSERSREGIDRLSNAMIAEAQGLARTRYEKSLLAKVQGGLAVARGMARHPQDAPMRTVQAMQPLGIAKGFARDFIVGDPGLRVSWDDSRDMVIAGMPARMQVQAAQPMAMPGGALGAAQPGNAAAVVSGGVVAQGVGMQPKAFVSAAPVIHCRHGAPSACNLDERDARGLTALHSLVDALKPAEVKALLDAGADPSIAAKPSGVPPVETLLERMLRAQPGTPEAQGATALLHMLAAHPKVTLRPKLGEDLAADPATWTSTLHSPGRTLLVDARERLRALPVRAEEPPACAPLNYAHDYERLPVRLRHP